METITKDEFVSVLNDAGISDAQKQRLHAAFEKRFPEAHQRFLEYLGISAELVAQIRSRSRDT